MNSKYLQLPAITALACLAMLTVPTSKGQTTPSASPDGPAYTATGDLKRPQNYRESISSPPVST